MPQTGKSLPWQRCAYYKPDFLCIWAFAPALAWLARAFFWREINATSHSAHSGIPDILTPRAACATKANLKGEYGVG